MYQNDYKLVSEYLEEIEVSKKTLAQLEYSDTCLFLQRAADVTLETVNVVDDFIGFSSDQSYEVGQFLKNPFCKYLPFEVIEVDTEGGRVLLKVGV